ncbi:MAG: hypothetical protein A2Z99_05560 [Treponema sp. GWB1_62_6]|nr:MAG: hypothetical protein A2001_16835 [Treponema sp. GWC1_61_84]OHE67232.1 MAG: hypothetical protein A2Y36_08870 [Treponema sp. GWA1_62_8]OHE70828.1 MAG: hypothetical protein A2Z99_05560 [Treponema sp. GWB1_62_6]
MREKSAVLPNQLQVLLACAALHFLAIAEFRRLHPLVEEIANWKGQFDILLALSFLSSLKLCLDFRSKSTWQLFPLQVFFLLNMNYPERGNVTLAAILFGIPLLEASLFELNAIWPSTLIPLLALVSAVVHPVPFWDDPIQDPDAWDLLFLAGAMALQSWIVFRFRRMSARTAAQADSLSRQNTSIDNLLNANLDFQTYAAEIGEKSTIEERKRLTREVHDIVGYTLINLRMMMEAAIELTPPENERLRDLLNRARDQVMSGLLETRGALRNFRAIDTAVTEGANRIQRFVKSFSQATGIAVDISYGNIPRSFGQEIDGAVVRIIQESMTNAFRHGKATEIQIGLWVDEGRLLVKITDNGIGSEEVKPGIGLSGMGERLDPLHGSLSARNGENGFVVDAIIPLKQIIPPDADNRL